MAERFGTEESGWALRMTDLAAANLPQARRHRAGKGSITSIEWPQPFRMLRHAAVTVLACPILAVRTARFVNLGYAHAMIGVYPVLRRRHHTPSSSTVGKIATVCLYRHPVNVDE